MCRRKSARRLTYIKVRPAHKPHFFSWLKHVHATALAFEVRIFQLCLDIITSSSPASRFFLALDRFPSLAVGENERTGKLPFLALLDYVSRAHEIEIHLSSVVRHLSSVVCRPSVRGIDYLWSYCMDFFQISVVASPGTYAQTFTFFDFLALLDYVSRAHEIEIRPSSVRPSRNYLWT